MPLAQELVRQIADRSLGFRRTQRLSKGVKSGDDSGDVAVYGSNRQAKSHAEDGSGCVFSNARETQKLFPVLRKPAPAAGNDLLCRSVEMPGSGVVAKVFPEFQDLFRASFSQGIYGGEPYEKTLVIRDHCIHLGLLEHDLRDPDEVRVPGMAPGEIPGMAGIPSEQFRGDRMLAQRGFSLHPELKEESTHSIKERKALQKAFLCNAEMITFPSERGGEAR
jgi:hypothetical protein